MKTIFGIFKGLAFIAVLTCILLISAKYEAHINERPASGNAYISTHLGLGAVYGKVESALSGKGIGDAILNLDIGLANIEDTSYPDGAYAVDTLPGRNYALTARKEGYHVSELIEVDVPNMTWVLRDIKLHPILPIVDDVHPDKITVSIDRILGFRNDITISGLFLDRANSDVVLVDPQNGNEVNFITSQQTGNAIRGSIDTTNNIELGNYIIRIVSHPPDGPPQFNQDLASDVFSLSVYEPKVARLARPSVQPAKKLTKPYRPKTQVTSARTLSYRAMRGPVRTQFKPQKSSQAKIDLIYVQDRPMEWVMGSKQPIQWSYSNLPPEISNRMKINIELINKSTNKTIGMIAKERPLLSKSFQWNVGQVGGVRLQASSEYAIRMTTSKGLMIDEFSVKLTQSRLRRRIR